MKVKREDTIRKALETIEGVTGVEMSYDSDEKLWKTKLSIQENVDIREKVFYAMAKANCPIYEMQVKRVSLEDVFLELTERREKIRRKTGKLTVETGRRQIIGKRKNSGRKKRGTREGF